MLLQRNLLEKITLTSNGGIILCVLLHYLTDLSLLPGKWFFFYIVTVFIVSVFLSFKSIQWLLKLNRPIGWVDVERLPLSKQLLCGLRMVYPQLFAERPTYEWKEYDTNELSVISSVLERKLVSSWYTAYISEEIGFPFACKQMLDQMIGRAFQICRNIETKDVFVDVSTILSLHLKEYEKAVKRHEKSPNTPIECLYKKSHPISDGKNKYTSVEHCTNILRIMIKELLPWELKDTPHSELLVRILSKKLDSYIDSTLADPDWLNNKLVTYLTGEEYVEFKEPETNIPSKKVEESVEMNEHDKNVSDKATDIVDEPKSVSESPVEVDIVGDIKEVKSSPVMRQKRGRQGRNEVKIYDRIIEGSVKTWETDTDLQCISLGQDLLAQLDGEMTLSRLWGHEEPDGSPDAGKAPPPLWFGEEDALELEPSPRRSPKPDVLKDLQKDLQSTVHHAKTKIGDLQVRNIAASDEAAGMMEGLLDFGIAGLKKGLRFTGLSDDQEKSPPHRENTADGTQEWKPRLDIPEQATIAFGNKEENGSGTPPLLVKQQRVTSQDSVPQVAIPSADSPEPQYEEAADLSTSIAKLRRLLRQRAEAQPVRSDEVWWEGAEETRGRTQQRHSSRPVEAATLADEYDMNLERNSPNQTTNNMQRLDKLFQRTVTGVFNSIKTATRSADETPSQLEWAYVPTNQELSVCVVAARLAWARRAGGVEAALDSLQLHELPAEAPLLPEDLEEWVVSRGRRWAGGAAAARLLHSHVAHRLATVFLAELCEWLIASWLEDVSSWLRGQIFTLFSRMEEGAATAPTGRPHRAPAAPAATAELILNKMTLLTAIFGADTVSPCIERAVLSFSHAAVNRDITYRVLDLLALHFKMAAGVRNPSFDAN